MSRARQHPPSLSPQPSPTLTLLHPQRPAAATPPWQHWPPFSTSFLVLASILGALQIPSQCLKKALFPTAHFSGNLHASLQALSRDLPGPASLPTCTERTCVLAQHRRQFQGALPARLPVVRFREASLRSSSKLSIAPPLTSP